MLKRVHLKIRGRVQRVGLRRRAARYAPEYNITGWVKNNPDDSVEMELQGEEGSIDAFLGALEGFAWFDEIESRTLPLADERDFEIRR